MGLEVKIRMVGRKRGGEKWLDSAYSVYETRLKPANLRGGYCDLLQFLIPQI